MFFILYPTTPGQLGWYIDHESEITLSPTFPDCLQTVELVGLVEYNILNVNQKVILRIEETTTTNRYYVMFNRGILENAGTGEQIDFVMVTEQDDSPPASQSNLLAQLGASQSHSITNYNSSGEDL